MASDDVFFEQGFVAGDAAVAQARQINGAIGAMDDEFGDGISRCRTLLQAMAGKSVGEMEITQPRT